MLEPPSHLRVDPAPFKPQPMGGSVDKGAARFELERQACQSLRQVLQLKLQQRRTRQELINQGIMPPLKSSAAFHEHRRSLERAQTEDYLKRKIRCRPERSELIRMHILEEASAEPPLQAWQLQLKRARLADDLNDKLSQRPGPMELIHKNILPVHSSIKHTIIDFPRGSGESSSFEEDSNDSLSPEPPGPQTFLQGPGPLPSPPDTLAPSPTQFLNQVPTLASPIPPGPASTVNLTNGAPALASQSAAMPSLMKSQHKMSSDHSYRPKKPMEKPKIRKLKYHQYVPPDQRGGKERPPAAPQLDSSYSRLLQQQQLFLQLQILSQQKLQQRHGHHQQQQQHNYSFTTVLPSLAQPQRDQSPPAPSCPSSSSSSTTDTTTAPSTSPLGTTTHPPTSQGASTAEDKPIALPPNLDEMKVAELKSELKQRCLTVSGTKSDLIERLRAYQQRRHGEAGAGGDAGTASSSTPGGVAELVGARGVGGTPNSQMPQLHPGQLCSGQPDDSSGAAVSLPSVTRPEAPTPPPLPVTGCVGPPETHSPARAPGGGSLPPVSPGNPCGAGASEERLGFNSQPPVSIKEEPTFCAQASPPQRLCAHSPADSTAVFSPADTSVTAASVASATSATTTSAPQPPGGGPAAPSLDRDKMLREKDRQIEMLTRMLQQKQRLVDVLKMQLDQGKRGARGGGGAGGGVAGRADGTVAGPAVLIQVKEEPPETCVSTSEHPPSLPCETASTTVTVKRETIWDEGATSVSDSRLSPCPMGPPPSFAQEPQGPAGPPTGPGKSEGSQVHQRQLRLQQAALQLAQQRAIQKLLEQRQEKPPQRTLQNPGRLLQQNLQDLQERSQQRKKKSHKQQVKQQQQQAKQQQTPLKQQALLKPQQLPTVHNYKQHPTQQKTENLCQQGRIQAKVQQKPQPFLQAKQQTLKQSNQGSQHLLCQQRGSLHLDLLKTGISPALLTDGNGNHFLVALTNHMSEIQKAGTLDNKSTTHITLKGVQSTPSLPGQSAPQIINPNNQSEDSTDLRSLKEPNRKEKAGLGITADQSEQGDIHSLPSFLDKEDKVLLDTSSIKTEEMCFSLDHTALFSPLSPASIRTPVSSPGYKENTDDLFDILFQTGEISSSFKLAPDPFLDGLHPRTPVRSPPRSSLQLVLSPPTSPPAGSLAPCPQVHDSAIATTVENEEKRQPLHGGGGGRLEDFLESATGTPLLGVEPGSPVTPFDDLHSQMLSTPSILDHPHSPMDLFDLQGCMAAHPSGGRLGLGEQMADVLDWLDLTIGAGEAGGKEAATLDPLASPTPASVFSADFLNSSDLQIYWDACL